MTKRKSSDKLKISDIMRKFKEAEESPPHHSGTFKIDAPFEDAVKSILKASPKQKKKPLKPK
jgi:hypothetical protein